MQALLEASCEVDAQDQDGYTALMVAARGGDFVLVMMWLEASSNLDLKSVADLTTMGCAGSLFGFEVAEELKSWHVLLQGGFSCTIVYARGSPMPGGLR